MPLAAYGYSLKLRVADNDSIVIPGRNPGAKLFAPVLFKVPLGSHQDIGVGVEPQKLTGPLLGDMVRNYNHGLGAQAQPFHLHSGGGYFKGLACAHTVGEQGIAPIDGPGDGVFLVFL